MSFTPGPWEWSDCDDFGLVNPTLFKQWVAAGYKDDDWPFVLQGEWHNDSSAGITVTDENKALIAAAPDLLQALKDWQNYSLTLEERQNKAIAAIKKAEGR